MQEYSHGPFEIKEVPFIPVRELELIPQKPRKIFLLTATSAGNTEMCSVKITSKSEQNIYKCSLSDNVFYTEVPPGSELVLISNISGLTGSATFRQLKGKFYQIEFIQSYDDRQKETI